jgi:hypothetical protein
VQASNIPAKVAVPFASSAGGAYITNPIPVTTSTPNAASYTLGFPPSTFLPGGAPKGADFNGILYEETAWSQWLAAGGPITYDATFQTAIGGYPAGARLLSGDSTHEWISTADNNMTDPDTGGAGWSRFPVQALGSIAKIGTATLPASGAVTSTVAITFSPAFPNACDFVALTAGGTVNSTNGGRPILGYSGLSASGFTAAADTNTGQLVNTAERLLFNQTVPLLWQAWGH